MIELRDVRYAWPGATTDCLAIDSLNLAAGRTLFLHGPSGGGKSTLLGLLAGVLLPRRGSVSLLGQRWSDLSGARRDAFRADHVGYIFQQFNLLPYLSVLDNVLLPCRFSALRRQRAAEDAGTPEARAQQLLQSVGLSASLWARPAAQRCRLSHLAGGRPSDQPSPAIGGCAVPLGRDFGGGQCDGHHADRHGR